VRSYRKYLGEGEGEERRGKKAASPPAMPDDRRLSPLVAGAHAALRGCEVGSSVPALGPASRGAHTVLFEKVHDLLCGRWGRGCHEGSLGWSCAHSSEELCTAAACMGQGAFAGALPTLPAARYPAPRPQPAVAGLTRARGVQPYPAATDRAAGLWWGCWRSSGQPFGCPGAEAAVPDGKARSAFQPLTDGLCVQLHLSAFDVLVTTLLTIHAVKCLAVPSQCYKMLICCY